MKEEILVGIVIDKLKTKEYPIRYVAFKNPGVWVEHENPEDRGGFEWAVYCEPYYNRFEDTEDGIYITISSFQGEWLLLECLMTVPNKKRKQFTLVKRYLDYSMAKIAAYEWLLDMRKKLKAFTEVA